MQDGRDRTADAGDRIDPAAVGIGHRATLATIARAADVSIATASKVVNGRVGVGATTRRRVEQVIGELGYVSPGERQSALAAVRELTVELLADPRDVLNPYLSTLLGGAMQQAAGSDAGLVLRSIDAVVRSSPIPWAQRLARAGRAGVIEVTSHYSAERERALRAVGLAMVLVDPLDRPRTSVPSVGADDAAGARAAVRHLLGLGHRRIAYVGGPAGAACDVAREGAWAATMAEAGLPVDRSAVPHGPYGFDHGLAAGTTLLAGAPVPTAIFAGNDMTAAGVLEAARRAGVAVPERLSVVGFDDTLLASTSTPRLTTVHQPIAEIGAHAVSTLLRLAAGESLSVKRIELTTALVVRDSTAPVPVHRLDPVGAP